MNEICPRYVQISFNYPLAQMLWTNPQLLLHIAF